MLNYTLYQFKFVIFIFYCNSDRTGGAVSVVTCLTKNKNPNGRNIGGKKQKFHPTRSVKNETTANWTAEPRWIYNASKTITAAGVKSLLCHQTYHHEPGSEKMLKMLSRCALFSFLFTMHGRKVSTLFLQLFGTLRCSTGRGQCVILCIIVNFNCNCWTIWFDSSFKIFPF